MSNSSKNTFNNHILNVLDEIVIFVSSTGKIVELNNAASVFFKKLGVKQKPDQLFNYLHNSEKPELTRIIKNNKTVKIRLRFYNSSTKTLLVCEGKFVAAGKSTACLVLQLFTGQFEITTQSEVSKTDEVRKLLDTIDRR